MTQLWTSERRSRFRLARTPGIGPLRFSQALDHFETAEKALDVLASNGKITPPSHSQIEDEIADVRKLGGTTLIYGDEDYPPSLASIPDFPPILHVKGRVSLLSNQSIAIVGARNASTAGRAMAALLAKDLSEKNITIVSGLASGIDGQAHQTALKACASAGTETGSTIAALPGGLDVIYPKEHQDLYDEIAEYGCVITEAPPGANILARHFPRRNRLIAGISLGAVIIEAAQKSGTLITARLSLEYGRLVFAVPGSPVDPRSAGGNHLLKEGALLVENAQDILPHLPDPARIFSSKMSVAKPAAKIKQVQKTSRSLFSKEAENIALAEKDSSDLPPEAKKILCLLSPVPIAIDHLVRQSQLSVQEVLTSISFLNMLERVTLHDGDRIALAPQK